ncbi:hypothetical protein Ahy_A01g001082 [Arachis hypogaea]|uniref:UBC core domain-containing protein n=1 Tax=Arachis hypogaea TaxID=3818 RepID=A0A445EM07_ARAHY|nr:hypothetical protein Ahy_A01g001082 [Arachis hypogaea]
MEEVESVFNTFDIVSEISNHHFLLLDEKDSSFSNAKSSVYTHIMKEWKILEEHLPDSIYVRVYESRIDLMRAVIVGTAGTPYHDGLFFFDIKLSSKYPNNSLILYFHSFRLGLNLNFYNSGDPTKSETYKARHCPRSCSQSKLSFSIKNSTSTSIGRFTPPKNYEAFIRNHFRTRVATILAACQEYASGRVMVGYYCGKGLSPSLSCSKVKILRFFRKMLRKNLYPKLVQIFQSLESFHVPEKLELDEDEQENNSDENKGGRKIIVMASPKDKRKVRIFKKVVARIKRVMMRWKNKNSSRNNKITS